MISPSYAERRRLEALDGPALEEHQLARLNALLEAILPHNRFYAEKLAGIQCPLASLDQLNSLPLTHKDELIASPEAHGAAGHRTYPLEQYVRYHQTSGTRGRPLPVLDTAADWRWWIDTWQFVLDAARASASDVALLAFSFGPFVGFWSAFDALVERGALVVPGGGMNTVGRLQLLRSSHSTLLLCTPSYALHLAEVGEQHQIDVGHLGVRCLILAGEPGGSIAAVRSRIEDAWQAEVVDHAGATEVGPWGYGDAQGRGLRVIESEFIAEFRSVETGKPAGEGELAELILTTLGRAGSPVIRYRTGDLVRPSWNAAGENRFVFLPGGIVGRSDDMLVIRGVNIFPSAIEQILRSFPEVVEYRLTVYKLGQMDHLRIDIEDRLNEPARIRDELRLRLGLKVEVETVAPGTLPRFEGKGRRLVDER